MEGGTPDIVGNDVWAEPTAGLPAFQRRSVSVAYDRANPVGSEQPESEADELKVKLLNYLRVAIKRRWIIIAVATVVLAIGVVMTLMTTPLYTASTTLQIDREAAKVVDKNDDLLPTGGDAEFYQTQYELLKSRSLAERVVVSLTLSEIPLFAPKKPGALTNLWRSLFGSQDTSKADSAMSLQARQRVATDFVQSGLTVEAVRLSRLVRLSFESPDAQLSQQIVNAVAENFIATNLDRKYDASSYARKFLEERLAQLKVRLEESDQQLVAYAKKEEILNLDNQETLVGSELAAADAQLTSVKNDRMRNEQLWLQAKSADGMSLSQVLSSPTIQSLRGSRAELLTEYQQKLNLFKPDYPEMVALQARIAEIDTQVNAEVDNIKSSIRSAYEASFGEESILIKRLNDLKAKVLDLRARSVQYNILQREVDTNRTLYDGLLQRYKEIGVAGGVGTNNVSVVDRAELPLSRSSPKLGRNLELALLLGLVCGVLCAFGLEHLDDTLKTPEDIETKLGLAVLGVIPKVAKGAIVSDALKDPKSALSEAYRSLCTALQFSTETGIPKSLFVTSSRPAEGKSTTAVTLGRNFAHLGGRVLLIDADLRNPSLHHELEMGNDTGLSNYLAGGARPPELLRATDTTNLTFMPAGPMPPNPAELLASPKMMSLLTIGAEVFDLVIIDGPPVMGLADAPLLASMAAGTLIVTAAGEARQGVVKQAIKRLQFARAHVVGVLLTKFDPRRVGYTYGYGYGYGDDYQYGYGKDVPKIAETEQALAAE